MAYCPIQDMGSADIAYEWMFNVLSTRALVSADQKAGLIVDATGSATLIKKAASTHVKAGKPVVAFNAFGSAAANGVASGTGTLRYQNDFIDVDATGTGAAISRQDGGHHDPLAHPQRRA